MSELITVGISDLNIARNGDVLVTYALGSCVGICLYDSIWKVAGLAHIMLPESTGFNPTGAQIYKFANLAIPALIEKMERVGAKRICVKAKIAGGAQMFAVNNESSLSNIGQRNVIAVRAALQRLNIPILVEDVGKDYGRTQFLSSADGSMRIRSVNRGEWTY